MKNENTVIANSDFKSLMLATFRYSLGRRTYMPSFIVDLIIKNAKRFHKLNWKQFLGEINEVDDLGDSYDIQTWNTLIYFCEKKLKNKSEVNKN